MVRAMTASPGPLAKVTRLLISVNRAVGTCKRPGGQNQRDNLTMQQAGSISSSARAACIGSASNRPHLLGQSRLADHANRPRQGCSSELAVSLPDQCGPHKA